MTETHHSMATRNRTVDIFVGERDGHTVARARLHTADPTSLEATGYAHLNPTEEDVPEIGDEVAVSKAQSALSHRLLEAAAGDMEDITHTPASLEQ